MIVPAAVQVAVAEFVESEQFALRPPRSNESSFIYKGGVRVLFKPQVGEEQLGWICLADQNCRENITFTPMYSGRTSRATKHLKEAHNCTSEKHGNHKRTREEEIEDLKASPLMGQYPKRMRFLLETKRVVLDKLPFPFGETDDARIVSEICMKDEFKAVVNSKTVSHAIVELYASTKQEVLGLLREHDVANAKILTVVIDFWTCKTQHTKYLGVRVYFVDKNWKVQSILLGTRRFNPSYGDRDTGIRRQFRRWITQMLIDFGLSTANLFGGMSDAGPDVRWMLQSGLGLQWHHTSATPLRRWHVVL